MCGDGDWCSMKFRFSDLRNCGNWWGKRAQKWLSRTNAFEWKIWFHGQRSNWYILRDSIKSISNLYSRGTHSESSRTHVSLKFKIQRKHFIRPRIVHYRCTMLGSVFISYFAMENCCGLHTQQQRIYANNKRCRFRRYGATCCWLHWSSMPHCHIHRARTVRTAACMCRAKSRSRSR